MLYFFVALTVVALGYFVAWPLLQPSSDEVTSPSTEHVRTNLVKDERAQLENTLAEAEFDFSTGKINEDEWNRVREPLVKRLAETAEASEAQNLAVDDTELELEIQIARARLRLKASA
jgi:leucyl aminopeptidase (aminopeptidase T)